MALSSEYTRLLVQTLVTRMNEPRRFIQILMGPRQTGKTTALRQAVRDVEIPVHAALAERGASDRQWLQAQWEMARGLIDENHASALLIVDEIQMVPQWSSVVKALWDEDAWSGIDLRVVLSGSSSLLLQEGLTEGLTGRFEAIRCGHWCLSECREAFGYSTDDFLFFGGYPGAAALRHDVDRWLAYMDGAIIEPSISRDVVSLNEVRKPELMHRLFYLGAPYSARELSYRKMLGQMDDAGNTTTIAHYLRLLDDAGLLAGLQKYDPKLLRSRASSPRLAVYDTSLMTATYGQYRDFLLADPERRGHLVESAVGAYLLGRSRAEGFGLYWWREGDAEVDFVVEDGMSLLAIEVKSGRRKGTRGLAAFVSRYPHATTLIVGAGQGAKANARERANATESRENSISLGTTRAASLEDFLQGNVPLWQA